MLTTIEVSPDIAKKILADASAKGLSVEVYLREIIESKKEDERIKLMQEATNDELFLADLTETMEDFRHTDFE